MDLEMWIEYLRVIRGMNGIAMREWGRLYSRVSVGLGLKNYWTRLMNESFFFLSYLSIPSVYLYDFK